jgi:protein arginine kinase activator
MKCEICHEADAAAVIHVKKDGEDKELFVCKSCAAKAKHPAKKKPSPERDNRAITFGEDEEPPEFVKNLVEATLGFMKGVAESGHRTHTKCPACKTTWEQIKKSGHFGCPVCWKTFAKSIRETFLAGEYGPKHVGAMPATVTGEASRAYLERELKAAVAREDFKRAASLKRLIEALDKKEES